MAAEPHKSRRRARSARSTPGFRAFSREPSLAFPSRSAHSYSQMLGMFFDNPAVRFSRRLSFYQIRMRYFASLLFRWLTGSDGLCARIDSRCHEAEFPAVTRTAYQLLVRTFL